VLKRVPLVERLSDRSLLKLQAYINGEFIGIPNTAVKNPANGQVIAAVPNLGAPEAERAVEAASAAFGGWANRICKERSAILRRWYDLVIAAREDLAIILTSEQGKPLSEARGEIDYAAAYIEFYAEEAKRIFGELLPSHRANARILVQRRPVGVVAAITPWNFPAAMITRKIAPALAAGCTVVVKPAPETPLTALALAELAHRAGVPSGVINVVTGDAQAIGLVLTTHQAVRLVGFTGSTQVGKLLMSQAATTVKKVALELGGNAPFIVFDDAELDAAVEGALVSKFRNTGQTCVCTNRIYVQDRVHDVFVKKFADKVAALRVGDGLDASTEQGPLISAKALAKVRSHVDDALSKGATLVVGGDRHVLGGTFFQPTLLQGATDEMLLSKEETFGPVAAIFRFKSESEAIAAANNSTAGLAAYFYSQNASRVFRVLERLDFGMVGVNTGLISTELAPFGGVKESGNSREGSHHGILEFTELRYACVELQA